MNAISLSKARTLTVHSLHFILVLVLTGISVSWAQTTVTLFPTVDALVKNQSGLLDSSFPTTSVFRGYAWTASGVNTTQRSFLKIDLSSIPAGATISSADLTLYGLNHNPSSGSNACWLDRCTQDWTETGLTWNNQPTITTSGRKSLPQSTSSSQNYTVDITDFVQGWISGAFSNYGVRLKLQTELKYRSMEFASSDHTTSSKHPKVVITYTTTEKNHVARYLPNQAWSNPSTLPTTSKEVSQKLKDYRDLQGRPLQAVSMEASPTGKDIILPNIYDDLGRQHKSYLPFAVTTTNNGEYFDDAINPSNWTSYYGTFEDDYTYAETTFETSPLSRPLQQGATGSNWAIGSGHEIQFSYESNVANQVFRWYLDNTGYLPKTVSGAYYPANYLAKTTTTDEQGNMVVEFTDKKGRTILKKVQTASSPSQTSHSGWANTYYVYDEKDNMVFILPPKLVEDIQGSVTSNYTVNNSRIQNLAFQYKYDSRQRVVESRSPGSQWIYTVYDDLDRVVMIQDGNQRSAVEGTGREWTVTKYDALDRPIITGVYTHGSIISQSSMAALISTTSFNESYNGSTTNHGYTNAVWPTSGVEIMAATYYDNYNFLSISGWDGEGNDYSYQNPGTPYESSYFANVKGQVTGSKVKLLNTQKYLNTVTYYDDRYRPIQVISENHKGTLNRVSNRYDFTGNLLDSKTEHESVYDIVWTDLINVIAQANSLEKNAGSTAWNGGAASSNILPSGEDGWIEVVVSETNLRRMIGLSDVNTNANWNTLDYAIYLTTSGVIQIRESGSNSKASFPYSTGDVLRIERVNNTIYYKKNGSVIYTSLVSSTTQLVADVSMYHIGSTLKNVNASFGIPNEEDPQLITTERSYDYDHMGRLLEVRHQTEAQTEVLLAENSYNELGELDEKDLHSLDNGSTHKQSVDYSYNIRGWLTQINNAQLSSTNGNNDNNDFFGMELGYESSLGNIGAVGVHNGNISSMKWSVKHSADGTGEAGYAYSYDRMNRLTAADYKRKISSWNDLSQYGLESLTYDKNGNIKTLTRKNPSGGNLDVLTYNYGSSTNYSNQLGYVNDSGNPTEGFKNANTGTNDYTYDASGNMNKDLNKGITDIDYNYLDLPELVTFDATKYIKYYYDASGIKVRQEVYEDDIAVKIIDYIGEAVIENNLITELAHEEGRIVPDRDEINGIEKYLYQYHLTDHLGNIRVTFGEEDTDTYMATMESENQTVKDKEEAIFNNMFTRVVSTAANHTSGGNEAARLNSTQPIGPAISLNVYPGDDIDMDVWAHYGSSSGYGSQIAQTTWINELASAFGGINGGLGEAGAIYDGINAIGAGLFAGSNGSSVPAAYLNYILFDEDFVQIPGGFGFVSISSAALNSTQHLVQSTVNIDHTGYIFIYVSNESNSSNWVYFDDLQVVRTEGEIKQETHYYPYGLAMADIGKQGSNAFTYQAKEWQSDLDLGLYDFHARQFDPILGRFISVDPAGQFASGYLGMGNNPVIGIDPDGEFVWLVPIAIGAVVNTAANWNHISSADNFWDGLGLAAGYATVGGLQGASTLIGGPIGYTLGGAIGGLGNGLLQGQKGGELWTSAGIGATSGLFGGVAAQRASRFVGDFASPLLDGLVKGTAGGLVGGFVGGGTASSLSGGDFWDGALAGAWQGAAFGATIGGASSSYNALKSGFNPLTGQRTQKWLSANASHENLQGKGLSLSKGEIVKKQIRSNIYDADFQQTLGEWNNIRQQYGFDPIKPGANFITDGFRTTLPDGTMIKAQIYRGGTHNHPNGWNIKLNSYRINPTQPKIPPVYLRYIGRDY